MRRRNQRIHSSSAARQSGLSRLDIVIPGAQKAGTSSLLNALGGHPAIVRHSSPEFGTLLHLTENLDAAVASAYPAGPDRLRIAKSAGLMFLSGGLERLHVHNPNTRLIFMLREPVNRMYSAYWFARRTGNEPLGSFAAAIAQESRRVDAHEDNPYVTYRQRSDYVTPLRRAVKLFGEDQVKVVLLEDYHAEREATLTSVQSWLNLGVADLSHTPEIRNAAASAKSDRVASLARSRGPLVRATRQVIPRKVGRKLRTVIVSANEKPFVPPPLDPILRAALSETFSPQFAQLRDEFGLDLTRWQHQ